jgi:uncharacterized protein YbjQ (UPF0145 family)
MTKNLQLTREDVTKPMIADALGVAVDESDNAVLAMRFDTSEMDGNWTEICAYGTVVVEPVG